MGVINAKNAKLTWCLKGFPELSGTYRWRKRCLTGMNAASNDRKSSQVVTNTQIRLYQAMCCTCQHEWQIHLWLISLSKNDTSSYTSCSDVYPKRNTGRTCEVGGGLVLMRQDGISGQAVAQNLQGVISRCFDDFRLVGVRHPSPLVSLTRPNLDHAQFVKTCDRVICFRISIK